MKGIVVSTRLGPSPGLTLGSTMRLVVSRARLAVNLRLPDKPVRRTVRGVPMTLPRRHGLPHFARPGSPYAENLVGPLPNVVVEPSVLVGPEAAGAALAIVHQDVGTSQVQVATDGSGLPTLTTDELLAKYPQLADVRLVKTDTDGYDVMLVPALARTFLPSRPVLFFEFDPRPTALATPDLDPKDLWRSLVGFGYEQALVWDNGGRLIEMAPTAALEERSAVLDLTEQERGYGFWDVAVAHKDDPVGRHVLAELSRKGPFVPRQRSGE